MNYTAAGFSNPVACDLQTDTYEVPMDMSLSCAKQVEAHYDGLAESTFNSSNMYEYVHGGTYSELVSQQ